MDEQASETAIPIGPDDEELAEAPSEHAERCYNLQSQILRRLEELRDDQKDYVSLSRERWGLAHDIPKVARKLLGSNDNAWEGSDPEERQLRIDVKPGNMFLRNLVPDTTNLLRARLIFKRWVSEPGAYSARWNKDYVANADLTDDQIKKDGFQWPNTWEMYDLRELQNSYCQNAVTYAIPNTSRNDFEDPLNFAWVDSKVDQNPINLTPLVLGSIKGGGIKQQHMWCHCVCGTKSLGTKAGANTSYTYFSHFSISRSFDIIDLNNAAAIISLTRGNEEYTESGPEFLDGHIAKWQERSMHERCGVRFFSIAEPGHALDLFLATSSIFMHYMRSFIVVSPVEFSTLTEPRAPGLKCLRDHISFRGFYNDTTTKLVERRYSTVLSLLPMQKPAGHYVSVSICDGQDGDTNTFTMFRRSPGSTGYAGRVQVWKRYEDTEKILRHNWESVSKRQRDASDRILKKLERTSNEVKSLQSGLFNVQSILEARKTRVLNKYLLVFTVVTILFLPPTFVATFFGMHIFDADTINTTQKVFWTVLGALSGGTYLIAAFGLFGSNLSAEQRKEWATYVRARAGALRSRLQLRFITRIQQIGGQREEWKEWRASLRARGGVLILELLVWADSFMRLVRNRLRLLLNAGNRQPGEQV
ncbi:hypothetical protein Hte_000200 [Hypoxylon texense]